MAALLMLGLMSPIAAQAACSTPAGDAGDQFFNTTVTRMQYCDGTNWVNMGVSGLGTTDNLGNHIATTLLRSDTHNTDDLGTTAIRWKDGWFAGTVTATAFVGDGSGLTGLPSGADNLGNHIATTLLRSDTHNTDDFGTTAIRWKDGWFAGTVTAGTFAGSGASLTGIVSAGITDSTITNADIATGGVTTVEILDSTIASADIAADTIAAVDIATGGVATAEILDSTITSADIAADTITAADIAADAVGIVELSATGTASSTTYLRGDNTWATPTATVPQGMHCGLATASFCDESASTCGAQTYTAAVSCNGSGITTSCPTGYTLRTETAYTMVSNCGTYTNYNTIHCKLYCVKT